MGRPRLSKAVHDARGHAGKRPSKTGRENPQPESAGPEPPVWMRWIPGVAVWKREIGKRIALGMHTVDDIDAFGRRCRLQAVAELYDTFLAEPDAGKRLEQMLASGLFVVGPRGGISPVLVDAVCDLENKLLAFDTQFGLTPKARGSLHVPGGTPDADADREQKYG